MCSSTSKAKDDYTGDDVPVALMLVNWSRPCRCQSLCIVGNHLAGQAPVFDARHLVMVHRNIHATCIFG